MIKLIKYIRDTKGRSDHMSITPTKFIPREMKTTIIRVYSYQNKNIQGVISNPFFKTDMVFENMMQLITIIEYISNSLLHPQKTMQLRQFSDNNGSAEPLSFNFETTLDFSDHNPLATFELEIIFRQNASWQGNIVYVEQNLSSAFRSVLELFTLLDSVLDTK